MYPWAYQNGVNGVYGMMGGIGGWWLMGIICVVVLIDLVLLGVFLYQKITKK